MSASTPTSHSAPATTLAEARLPDRARAVLEALLQIASDDLERRLGGMLAEFEQQLFRLADHARNPGIESGYLQTLRNMRLNRADLIPRFLQGVEAQLAGLGRDQPRDTGPSRPATPHAFPSLALVEHDEVDSALVLRDIAQRAGSRASLSLHLLGQRFGVLAETPAFDTERLPLGPHALCRILLEASAPLQLPDDAQELLLRTFDRKVMADYAEFAEVLNLTAAAEGILPALTYVPIRLRPSAATPDTATSGEGDAPAARRAAGADQAPKPAMGGDRPYTGWAMQMGAGETAADDEFTMLQELLSRQIARGRAPAQQTDGGSETHAARMAPGALGTTEVVALLSALGAAPAPAVNIGEIKRDLLARMRVQQGGEASLTREDDDTFDLLGMLYERIERDVRADTLAAALLRRLQVPVLQAALVDHGFFLRPQHPARQLLNTVAETGARWLGEGDVDPALLAPLKRAVDHVVANPQQGAAAFDESNRNLQSELQQQARRSEMAERRHVEAARGKEKLEIARRTAGDTISAAIGQRKPQKFIRALMEQAWADVLTLTLLRHSPDSNEWRQMVDATGRIAAACCGDAPAPDPELATQVESALSKVGYHAEEATAIASRLTSVRDADDASSRTELAASLKARARLGGEQAAAVERPVLPPRTPEEQAQYERVGVLPFGTWIEFVTNQQGDVVRKRLSWYSKISDNALFVNLRGQRVGEYTLDSLARALARGQARIVTVDSARLVDRAWQATLGALRRLAPHDSATTGWKAPA